MAWRFQRLVRGYLWTNSHLFSRNRCQLILWRGATETWAAAATLERTGERIRESFESQSSEGAGLDMCLAWLSDFISDYGLPSPALVEAWERLPGEAVPSER